MVILFAVLFAAGTAAFFMGRTSRNTPTATLSADARYYYSYLPSMFLDGDLDLSNQYRWVGNYYHETETATKKVGNSFGIGPAIFHAPFFLVGYSIDLARGARRDGGGAATLRITMYASFLWTFTGMVLAYFLCRRGLGAFASAMGTIAVFAGGPLLYYAIRQPGYSHPVAVAAAAAFVLAWDATRDRRSLRGWVLCGVLAGATALARPQNAIWSLLLVLDAGFVALPLLWRKEWPAALRALPGPALGAAAALLVFLPQMLAWRSLYGSWLTVPQGPGFMRWGESRWVETVFSSRNGLLPYAPILVLAFVGFGVLIRRHRRVGLSLLAIVFAQAYVNGAVWDWWAGGSFGGRRYDAAMVAFSLGLAHGVDAARLLLERRPRATAMGAIGLVALAFVALNCEAVRQKDAWTVTHGAVSMRGHYAALVAGLENRVYDTVGNPLALPASAVFAWRYGVAPRRWDEIVGYYFLNDEYLKPTRPGYKNSDLLRFAAPEHRRFLVSGFGDLVGHASRMSSSEARALVPINQPGGLDLRLIAVSTAELTLWWNNRRVGTGQPQPDGHLTVTGRVPAASVERGVNVIRVVALPGTLLEQLEMAPVDPGAGAAHQ
ncbi:MAG: hypothetical protein IT370_34390 [Deltaproteobacteria bacterium]|nr:hypothetical protein [Deltaproteobacteria bacterium]